MRSSLATLLVLCIFIMNSFVRAEEVQEDTFSADSGNDRNKTKMMGEQRIKCRVCLAAIDDMWHRAKDAQDRCYRKREYEISVARNDKGIMNEEDVPVTRDHDCKGPVVAMYQIEGIVRSTCETLMSRHDLHHEHPNGGDTHPDGEADGFKLVSVHNRTGNTKSRLPDEEFDQHVAERRDIERLAAEDAAKAAAAEAEELLEKSASQEMESVPSSSENPISPSMMADLIAHSTPNTHHEDDVGAVKSVCEKFLYTRPTVEKLTHHVYNHAATKARREQALPPLRKRFCFDSCTLGTRRRHQRHNPRHDYSDEL